MLPCQFLIGGQRVIDQDIPAVALGDIFLFVHHGIGTTFLQGIGGKLVSIKRSSFQGEEDGTLRTVAAVGGELLSALQIKMV